MNAASQEPSDLGKPRPELQKIGRLKKATEWTKIVAIRQWDEEFDSIMYPDGMDLALLQVEKRMMQPEPRSEAYYRVCESDLNVPGTEVKVSTQYGVYNTMTLASETLYSRLDFVAKHGDSGGGVFDQNRYCLLGIISSGGFRGASYVNTQTVQRFLDQSMKSEH